MDITAAAYQLMMRQKYTQLMKRVRVVEGIVMFCIAMFGRVVEFNFLADYNLHLLLVLRFVST